MKTKIRLTFSPLAFVLLLPGAASFGSSARPPNSFAYVLQADALGSKSEAIAKLAACGRDWIVLDADFKSGDPWTPADLSAIRAGKTGRKVIAYLSIGEAEDYRAYWRRDWDARGDGHPDAGAPAFLLAQDPEWKGNYRVKYWQPPWQQIILAEEDKIMAAGFDGVYLDIVDGFETFERNGKAVLENRLNPETKQSYRRDMVDWVKGVAARARKSNPAALVIPQNGTELLAQPDFLAAIDAVAIEDLFTNGDKPSESDVESILRSLSRLTSAQRPALDVEYARSVKRQALVRKSAAQRGLVWLITDRQLKSLGESGR